MSNFLKATMSDLRGGRQSWRVLLILMTPSFLLALTAMLLRLS